MKLIPSRLSGRRFGPRQIFKLGVSGIAAFFGTTYVPVGPLRVQIEPVPFCNLTCPACPRSYDDFSRAGKMLSINTFEHILDALRPLFINLTGFGETMLHPNLYQLLDACHARRIRSFFTTNATLLSPEAIQRLGSTGVAGITISLDTADPVEYAQIRRGDSLDRVVSRIGAALAPDSPIRSRIRINSVIFGGSANQVSNLLKLCWDRFGIVPGLAMEITDRARAFGTEDGGEKILKRLGPVIDQGVEAADGLKLPQASQRLRYFREILNGPKEVMAKGPCVMPWTNLKIYADGEVTPCVFWRPESRDGVLGNINEQSIADIWNGPASRALRRQHVIDRSAIPTCAECGYADWDVDSVFRRVVRFVPFVRLLRNKRTFRPRPKFATTE